jgi:anti-sigma B factor antagonist
VAPAEDHALERTGSVVTGKEITPDTGIDIAFTEEGALACVHGHFDIESSPAVRIQVLRLFEASSPGTLTIDLAGVTRIDSSGLATLIEALRIARDHDAELRLSGLHEELRRLFEFAGVLKLFDRSASA